MKDFFIFMSIGLTVLGIFMASSAYSKKELEKESEELALTLTKKDNEEGSDNIESVLSLQTEEPNYLASEEEEKVQYVNCASPDGKLSKMPTTVCEFVKNYWQDHPSGTEEGVNPTPTPTATPKPVIAITDVEGICTNYFECDGAIHVKISGISLDQVNGVYAKNTSQKDKAYKATSFRATSNTQIDALFYKENVDLGIGEFEVQVTSPIYSTPIQSDYSFTTE